MPPPGAPPQGMPPQGAPPGTMPNPAFQQWQQQMEQVQAAMAENAKRQKQFDDAVALIKRDGIRGFRLDIETDSTISPDEMAEKQARVEFMQQFVPLMSQVIPMAMGNPAIARLARETVLFAMRGFRVGRELEETVEQAFDGIAQMPPDPSKQGKQPARDPKVEMAKVQADVHDTGLKAQVDAAAIAQKAQEAQQNAAVAMARVGAEREKTQAQAMQKAAELAQADRHEMMRAQTAAADNMLRGIT